MTSTLEGLKIYKEKEEVQSIIYHTREYDKCYENWDHDKTSLEELRVQRQWSSFLVRRSYLFMVVLLAEHLEEVFCGGSSEKLHGLQVVNTHEVKLCRNSLGGVNGLMMSSPIERCHVGIGREERRG